MYQAQNSGKEDRGWSHRLLAFTVGLPPLLGKLNDLVVGDKGEFRSRRGASQLRNAVADATIRISPKQVDKSEGILLTPCHLRIDC